MSRNLYFNYWVTVAILKGGLALDIFFERRPLKYFRLYWPNGYRGEVFKIIFVTTSLFFFILAKIRKTSIICHMFHKNLTTVKISAFLTLLVCFYLVNLFIEAAIMSDDWRDHRLQL